MRDIRRDLRERLESLTAKREALQREVNNLAAAEEILSKLLAEEERHWARISPPLFEGADDKPSSPLSQVLLDTLRLKSGRASLDELKEAAVGRGVLFGDKKPGRVIHFAMLGMEQHDLVSKAADGRWELKENAVN